MPAAIPIAIIASSAMSMGGQALSNRSQSKAYEKQLAGERYSLDQQIALERERAAEEKRRYESEQSARAPYEKLRMGALEALLKGYGIEMGGSLAQLAGGGRPPAEPSGGYGAVAFNQPGAGQGNMSMLARGPQAGAAPQFAASPMQSPQMTMRDLAQLQAMMPVQALNVGTRGNPFQHLG